MKLRDLGFNGKHIQNTENLCEEIMHVLAPPPPQKKKKKQKNNLTESLVIKIMDFHVKTQISEIY